LLRNRCTIDAQSLRNRCEIAEQLVRSAAQSRRNRSTISA
jgi:hypothetical protein